jgi:hypothetical protein
VVERAYVEEWASDEHFTVDGTLIEPSLPTFSETE